MNIADEIALNTMRYKCSIPTPIEGDVIKKTFTQTIEPNTTVKLGSFIAMLPGTLKFLLLFPSGYSENVTVTIFRDDEVSTPLATLTKKDYIKNIDVLPFYSYRIFVTNNHSASIQVKVAVEGIMLPAGTTVIF